MKKLLLLSIACGCGMGVSGGMLNHAMAMDGKANNAQPGRTYQPTLNPNILQDPEDEIIERAITTRSPETGKKVTDLDTLNALSLVNKNLNQNSKIQGSFSKWHTYNALRQDLDHYRGDGKALVVSPKQNLILLDGSQPNGQIFTDEFFEQVCRDYAEKEQFFLMGGLPITTLDPLRLSDLSDSLFLRDNFPNLDWNTFPVLEELKSLGLTHNNIPEDILYTLSPRVPKLIVLSLGNIPFIHSFAGWIPFTNVRVLHLSDLSLENFDDLLETFPNLHTLNLINCGNVVSEDFLRAWKAGHPQIKEIKFKVELTDGWITIN